MCDVKTSDQGNYSDQQHRGIMAGIKHCVLSNGQEVYYRSKADVDILAREMFQHLIYLRHGITLKDGDCIFDVGANDGSKIKIARRRFESGKIIAFEPHPKTFARLHESMKSVENVELVIKDGVAFDSQKLIDSVKGRYGQY